MKKSQLFFLIILAFFFQGCATAEHRQIIETPLVATAVDARPLVACPSGGCGHVYVPGRKAYYVPRPHCPPPVYYPPPIYYLGYYRSYNGGYWEGPYPNYFHLR